MEINDTTNLLLFCILCALPGGGAIVCGMGWLALLILVLAIPVVIIFGMGKLCCRHVSALKSRGYFKTRC